MSDPTPQIVRRALALCRAAEPHPIDGGSRPCERCLTDASLALAAGRALELLPDR